MIKHKDWDVNEEDTGKISEGKPVMGAMFQNGLNDIEPDGSFVPCDTGVSAVARGVTYIEMNRGRMGELRFGDSSHPNSFLVKIKNKGLKGVSFKYTGATGNSMTANNGKPLCNFDNGISIESTPYYKGVKMDIIVNDPLTAPLEYPFSVKTYGQDYTFIEENGGATLRGEDQDPIFIKPPYAVDANGDIGPVAIHHTGMDGNLITFKKVVDETWFRQAAAPVRIDPDITIDDDSGTLIDTILVKATPDRNNGARNAFYAYKASAGDIQNGLMKVDLSALSGITVTLAYFGIDVWAFGGASQTIDVFECLKDWIEGTKVNATASAEEPTWDSQKHNLNPAWASGGCEGSGTDHAVSAESATAITATDSDKHFSLTNATVQDHIDNPGNNNGYTWITQDVSLSGNFWLGRSSEATTGNKPYFYMEYTVAAAGNPYYYYAQQ